MVGPGEVDGELESETANECEKFGRVIKCRIHEEKSPPTPPNKAVRIFVQFADFEAATKALEKMNGRFLRSVWWRRHILTRTVFWRATLPQDPAKISFKHVV